MNLEGTQLGHYRLTRFLKGGGMGEVYVAQDLSLPREVAIKVMKTERALYPNLQTEQEAHRLFQREMKVIATLDHPHILTLLEAGEQDVKHERIIYMVMPYCPAGSLDDWVRQYHGDSLLSPQEVLQLLSQASEALQYAHDQGVLHLDIKPQNFLVRRQQDPTTLPNLLLADFGVSKITNVTQMSGTPRGTVAYMAPEQLGMQPVPASDQYALAIMTYELLVGRTPFDGALPQAMYHLHANVMPNPPSTVNSSLPPALDAVILRALAKKPEHRFGSIREFVQAFATALTSSAAQASQEHLGSTGARPTTQGQWQPQRSVPSHPAGPPSPPSSQQALPPTLPSSPKQTRPLPPLASQPEVPLPFAHQQAIPTMPSSPQQAMLVPPPPPQTTMPALASHQTRPPLPFSSQLGAPPLPPTQYQQHAVPPPPPRQRTTRPLLARQPAARSRGKLRRAFRWAFWFALILGVIAALGGGTASHVGGVFIIVFIIIFVILLIFGREDRV